MADDQMDGPDGAGVPPGWHPQGIMAGVPALNAAAAQSTLGAVMTRGQMADVDWGGSDGASQQSGQQVAAAYDGVCRLPDGSLHPYRDAGGGYGVIYGSGATENTTESGVGAAANSSAMPTKPKPGGVAGGGESGTSTSPASSAARGLTGRARVDELKPLTGTSSVGGSLARAIPLLGSALMMDDFHQLDTAPVCEPVTDPNAIY